MAAFAKHHRGTSQRTFSLATTFDMDASSFYKPVKNATIPRQPHHESILEGPNMAKKKSQGVSKSQAIRDYLAEHPDAKASTIRPALAERGIDVSLALVGQIKQRMKESGGSGISTSPAKKRTVKKKSAGRKATRKKATSRNALSAENLVEAKKLVDDLGGIDQARQALKYLEKLG